VAALQVNSAVQALVANHLHLHMKHRHKTEKHHKSEKNLLNINDNETDAE